MELQALHKTQPQAVPLYMLLLTGAYESKIRGQFRDIMSDCASDATVSERISENWRGKYGRALYHRLKSCPQLLQ